MKSPGSLGSGGAQTSSDVDPVVAGLSALSPVQAEGPIESMGWLRCWSELDRNDTLGISVLSRPPSLFLQSREQLVVGTSGGTPPGLLHRWHCVPGPNSLQYTTGTSEFGEC